MFGKSLDHLCCTRPKPTRYSKPTPPTISKTFNSIYDSTTDDSEALTCFGSGFGSGSTSRTLTTVDSDPDSSDSEEPDLSSIFAARRLTRPVWTGRSKSIVDQVQNDAGCEAGGSGSVGIGPVPKMSADPYEDFKMSMVEMVDALRIMDGGDYQVKMQELLLCYLALNRKADHKHIVRAFADVFRGLYPN